MKDLSNSQNIIICTMLFYMVVILFPYERMSLPIIVSVITVLPGILDDDYSRDVIMYGVLPIIANLILMVAVSDRIRRKDLFYGVAVFMLIPSVKLAFTENLNENGWGLSTLSVFPFCIVSAVGFIYFAYKLIKISLKNIYVTDKTWKTVSYLFHPVLMPTLGLVLVMVSDPYIYLSLDSVEPWLILILSAFLSTAAMPLLFSWVLLKTGRVTSITNPTDNDRKQLIAFTELCFILAYFAFHNIPTIGKSLSCFMLGINIAMILTLVTSMVTKVSLHAVGIGGVLGTLIGLMYYTRMQMFPQIGVAMVIVFLVGYARYKLKAHAAADIYIGNIIGIASQALVFFIAAR